MLKILSSNVPSESTRTDSLLAPRRCSSTTTAASRHLRKCTIFARIRAVLPRLPRPWHPPGLVTIRSCTVSPAPPPRPPPAIEEAKWMPAKPVATPRCPWWTRGSARAASEMTIVPGKCSVSPQAHYNLLWGCLFTLYRIDFILQSHLPLPQEVNIIAEWCCVFLCFCWVHMNWLWKLICAWFRKASSEVRCGDVEIRMP